MNLAIVTLPKRTSSTQQRSSSMPAQASVLSTTFIHASSQLVSGPLSRAYIAHHGPCGSAVKFRQVHHYLQRLAGATSCRARLSHPTVIRSQARGWVLSWIRPPRAHGAQLNSCSCPVHPIVCLWRCPAVNLDMATSTPPADSSNPSSISEARHLPTTGSSQ